MFPLKKKKTYQGKYMIQPLYECMLAQMLQHPIRQYQQHHPLGVPHHFLQYQVSEIEPNLWRDKPCSKTTYQLR